MIQKFLALSIICTIFNSSYASSLEDLYASLIEKKREQISKALDLESNTEFWEVYDKFQAKHSEHDHAFFALTKKFNDKYDNGDIQEQSMINMQAEFFRIEGRKLQNKQNHVEFFSYTLPGEDVFRFFQIEAKLDALIRSKIAKKKPVIAPEVKLK